MSGPILFVFFSCACGGGGRVVDVFHKRPYGLLSRSNWTQKGAYQTYISCDSPLVVNPISVDSYGFLFNSTTVGPASDLMTALT